MQHIDFELEPPHEHVELNQLLKLVGVCDSGGAGKAIVASGAVTGGRRAGAAQDLQDPPRPAGAPGRLWRSVVLAMPLRRRGRAVSQAAWRDGDPVPDAAAARSMKWFSSTPRISRALRSV